MTLPALAKSKSKVRPPPPWFLTAALRVAAGENAEDGRTRDEDRAPSDFEPRILPACGTETDRSAAGMVGASSSVRASACGDLRSVGAIRKAFTVSVTRAAWPAEWRSRL